ncbi:hypothetical protein BDN72DRAFT_963120 [Pluteus cervinus]|uniref:Uncharacterized protein n=1 Tax=Pluteus cervinus TaxID=181527 RepID=A0ACD3AG80_9AGAR|nr:hypothetical protein BDN72DRAFT_963120 [Pluteus cervinus]
MAEGANPGHLDPLYEKMVEAFGEPPFSLRPEDLRPSEIWWRDHQPWLETCGYALRERFKPGWIPSWTQGVPITQAEDYLGLTTGNLIDAIRAADNGVVMLKKISRSVHPYEVELTAMWTEPHLVNHPHNHCVRLIEVLTPPDDSDIAIIVLPLFRRLFRPEFQTVGEVVEFFRQAFEGLKFIHENCVAHRDCNETNIMMDASAMYPEGWHLIHQNLAPGALSFVHHKVAKRFTRTEKPPKYYFIDFGISRRYDASDISPIEDIIRGGDKSPPEFENSTFRCNPFPTDVFYLGNVIRLFFLDGWPDRRKPGYHGIGFMRALVEEMVHEDPTKRPTMNEVVHRFNEILRRLSSWKLRSRLVPRKESAFETTIRAYQHWKRTIRYILQSIPPVSRDGDGD